MSWFDAIIEAAQKLGSLSAAAIFAFISIAQGYYIYRTQKDAMDSNEKWRLTREGQVRAEEAQTGVQGKLVEVTAMNTSSINAQTARIDILSTIIRERIPKKGDHDAPLV